MERTWLLNILLMILWDAVRASTLAAGLGRAVVCVALVAQPAVVDDDVLVAGGQEPLLHHFLGLNFEQMFAEIRELKYELEFPLQPEL